MPSDAHRKKLEQYALADRILATGFEMLACSGCHRAGKLCVVSASKSKRCSECVRVGKKCDVDRDSAPSAGDWRKLSEAEEKLEFETEKAELEMAEIAARLTRLRRQRKLLKRRGADMLRRGLSSVEELETLESEGQVHPEALLPNFSDPSFWAVLDPSPSNPAADPGGTAEVSSSS